MLETHINKDLIDWPSLIEKRVWAEVDKFNDMNLIVLVNRSNGIGSEDKAFFVYDGTKESKEKLKTYVRGYIFGLVPTAQDLYVHFIQTTETEMTDSLIVNANKEPNYVGFSPTDAQAFATMVHGDTKFLSELKYHLGPVMRNTVGGEKIDELINSILNVHLQILGNNLQNDPNAILVIIVSSDEGEDQISKNPLTVVIDKENMKQVYITAQKLISGYVHGSLTKQDIKLHFMDTVNMHPDNEEYNFKELVKECIDLNEDQRNYLTFKSIMD